MPEKANIDLTLAGLDDATPLYTIFGVCRSGTTAVEKLLALSGVHAFHQPIKSSFLRGITQLDLRDYGGPGTGTQQPVAIKETLGAYTERGCTFDPLKVICDSFKSTERMHTVFTIKEPFNNFLSWLSMARVAPYRTPVSTQQLLENFVLASQTLSDIFVDSHDRGIKTTVFDYESLRTQGSTAAAALLSRLGINPESYDERAWASSPSVSHDDSGITHVVPRSQNALHERLDASSGFQYFAPDPGLLPAGQHQEVQDYLERAGLYDAYHAMRAN